MSTAIALHVGRIVLLDHHHPRSRWSPTKRIFRYEQYRERRAWIEQEASTAAAAEGGEELINSGHLWRMEISEAPMDTYPPSAPEAINFSSTEHVCGAIQCASNNNKNILVAVMDQRARTWKLNTDGADIFLGKPLMIGPIHHYHTRSEMKILSTFLLSPHQRVHLNSNVWGKSLALGILETKWRGEGQRDTDDNNS